MRYEFPSEHTNYRYHPGDFSRMSKFIGISLLCSAIGAGIGFAIGGPPGAVTSACFGIGAPLAVLCTGLIGFIACCLIYCAIIKPIMSIGAGIINYLKKASTNHVKPQTEPPSSVHAEITTSAQHFAILGGLKSVQRSDKATIQPVTKGAIAPDNQIPLLQVSASTSIEQLPAVGDTTDHRRCACM